MQNKKNKGLTLMELIITIGILGLIMTAASTVVLAGFETFANSRQIQYDQNEARFAIMALTRDINHAQDWFVDQDTDRLILDIGNDQLILYYLDGTDLMRSFHVHGAGGFPAIGDLADPHPTNPSPRWVPPDWPVMFVGASLSDFTPMLVYTHNPDPALQGRRWSPLPPDWPEDSPRWLRITLTTSAPTQEGAPITVPTIIALNRT